MTAPGAPRRPADRRPPRDPYGIAPIAGLRAPIAAAIGLALIAWLTLALATGDLPFPGSASGNNGNGGATRTPAPSNVVIVDPRANVPGSIVYVKGGNVWIQSGTGVHQLTNAGHASMPSWSPDGQWIYYIETSDQLARHRPSPNEVPRTYAMTVPSLMRVRADASGQPEQLMTGRYSKGDDTWFNWIREPVVSPNGRTVALISDGPDATKSDLVVQFFDTQTKKLTNPRIPETIGHQDPVWQPDGRALLFVMNGRDGARGAPVIYRYNLANRRVSALTGAGYLSPAFSRDGRFIAATRTDSFGTDVVILDARTGAEVARVTNDDTSWSPVWSPKGDAIAYLHLGGGIVDLKMVKLTPNGGSWTVGETLNLTEVSGLDGASRPGWFIPPDQLPPLPTPTPPAASGGGSPAASTAP